MHLQRLCGDGGGGGFGEGAEGAVVVLPAEEVVGGLVAVFAVVFDEVGRAGVEADEEAFLFAGGRRAVDLAIDLAAGDATRFARVVGVCGVEVIDAVTEAFASVDPGGGDRYRSGKRGSGAAGNAELGHMLGRGAAGLGLVADLAKDRFEPGRIVITSGFLCRRVGKSRRLAEIVRVQLVVEQLVRVIERRDIGVGDAGKVNKTAVDGRLCDVCDVQQLAVGCIL